uniref:20-hydroxyecdysone protein n=1 Tax=Musca domestica TaxID=7370 RepID=T1PHX5_MUSDO
MRFSIAVLGIFFFVAVSQAAVVPRRYRNTEEILVPVTIIQDGEEIKEVSNDADLQSQVKNIATEVIAEEIAKAVDEEQTLEAVEAVVEAQRRLDEDAVKEEIKEAVVEENSELLKILQAEEENAKEAPTKEEASDVKEEETVAQTIKSLPQEEELAVQPDSSQADDKPADVEPSAQQLKSLVKADNSEEDVRSPSATNDDEENVPEATLRQATQATPGQTTQQNFVQQLIQSSPLGQFFNQITGQTQNSQQVANDETAPATPNPTIPAFLAPAISTVQNAAQSVVNTTQNAFQGLTSLATNLGTTFQNTLSSFGGQPPAQQQAAAGDATTARPQGPFQQLVNTFMGNNNPQATPAAGNPPQGPLQGLLNIFQGNNANNANATPQASTHSADTTATQPANQPEGADQSITTAEEVVVTATNLSNEIRNSAEVDDSFEDTNQAEELIVVQDDASPTQDQQQH